MIQFSLILPECSSKKNSVSPFRLTENHNFSKDLRLQVLSKRAKPYLNKPNLEEISNDLSDHSAFLEKNDCSIELPKNVEISFMSNNEKEEEVKTSQDLVKNLNVLTQSTQSLEDMRNFSSDGQDNESSKQLNKPFTRKNQKKNMTFIEETCKPEGEKKKKVKNKSSLKAWKEKRGVLRKLEQSAKMIGKISIQLKEVIEEEYSKGLFYFYIINN